MILLELDGTSLKTIDDLKIASSMINDFATNVFMLVCVMVK